MSRQDSGSFKTNENAATFIREYLANLHVQISVVSYGTVNQGWSASNFTSDFNRLYYICHGQGIVKVGQREYRPRPGQLVLLPAGQRLSYSHCGEPYYTKYWIHFTATIGDLHLFQVLDMPYCVDVDPDWDMDNRLRALADTFHSTAHTALLGAKVGLMDILTMILHKQQDRITLTASASIVKLENVLNYIDRNLLEPLSVEELAEIAHFHPNYFIPYFKRFIGLSPIQYINKLRMDRAKDLLLANEKSVSEIAADLGLQPYYFSRMFRQHTGYSPSDYKRIGPTANPDQDV